MTDKNPRTGERWMRKEELFGKGKRCTKHPRCVAVDGHPGPRFGLVNTIRQGIYFAIIDLEAWAAKRQKADG